MLEPDSADRSTPCRTTARRTHSITTRDVLFVQHLAVQGGGFSRESYMLDRDTQALLLAQKCKGPHLGGVQLQALQGAGACVAQADVHVPPRGTGRMSQRRVCRPVHGVRKRLRLLL